MRRMDSIPGCDYPSVPSGPSFLCPLVRWFLLGYHRHRTSGSRQEPLFEYLEELGSISAQFCPAPHLERSEEGNAMSGMFLYELLLKYHRFCQQIMQNRFARRSVVARQYNIFSVFHQLEGKACSDVHFGIIVGGTHG
jgi:hypothetical protein